MAFRLGCIADDITGGTDLALALSKNGLNVIQILGNATADIPEADAVVISLKMRTIPKQDAITKSLKAYNALKKWGATQIYFKYCSTFDSTSEGNIGPITEALHAQIKPEIVPFVPAFPENGRTVLQGHLYVNGKLLSDSPMKDHPLTPMTESDLCRHLTPQLKIGRAGFIHIETIEKGPNPIKLAMNAASAAGQNFLIMDCTNETHLAAIAKACLDLPLLTGGSAFAGAIAAMAKVDNRSDLTSEFPYRNGPVAILSGSCSAASNQQIRKVATNYPVIQLTIDTPIEDVLSQVQRSLDQGVFCVSSTAPPDTVIDIQTRFGKAEAGDAIEQKFAKIAIRLYQTGIRTFIIGGGETSGAVAKALGLKSLKVGPEIAPGVPWMSDTEDSGIVIAFKSGNFGAPDFFSHAVNSLRSSDAPNA